MIVKFFLTFFVLLISTSCSDDKKSRQDLYKAKLEVAKAQEEVCKKDSSCLDERAKKLSKDEQRVAHSETGNSFLDGKLCINECSEFIAGYDWADKRGITKEFGCIEHIGLFGEGCLGYVEDSKEGLHTDDASDYEYEYGQDNAPDCRPGRHGDC